VMHRHLSRECNGPVATEKRVGMWSQGAPAVPIGHSLIAIGAGLQIPVPRILHQLRPVSFTRSPSPGLFHLVSFTWPPSFDELARGQARVDRTSSWGHGIGVTVLARGSIRREGAAIK
jgi:hypothetical protein